MICGNEQLNATSISQFYMSGMLGYINGKLSINSMSAQYFIMQGVYSIFGIIGYVNGSSIDAINIYIQMQTENNQTGQYYGAFSGFLCADLQLISNLTIENSIITASACVGLVAVITSQISIQNIRISSSQMFSTSTSASISAFSGSIFAETQGQISIQCSTIHNMSIYSYAVNMWAISSGVIGDSHTSPITIQQTKVSQSTVQAFGSQIRCVTGSALLGFLYNASVQLQNTYVNNINLSTSSSIVDVYCSGYMSAIFNTSIKIINSKVTSITILASGARTQIGIIISNNDALNTLVLNGVSTEGTNMINLSVIGNCAQVINTYSQSGC
ncbi:Hypothetical_protein [Hexamita inflata]|uniref:Hypothetical_protein n=1 Tax=Hexamita inflata TaxID=28002 RepID=A0AA86QN03_9EUKA|nr:Hypothetical protein HINF_LOCUS49175 [Hexamita inflata]CAI9961531.1 Hypothetical protein HINF_LOCUS49176 [Hexamita inflata]